MSLADRIAVATEHPAAEGAAASIVLIGALVLPIVGGWLAAEQWLLTVGAQDTWLWSYVAGVVATGVGVWLFNRVLYQTVVYEWTANFVTWAQRYGVAFEDREVET